MVEYIETPKNSRVLYTYVIGSVPRVPAKKASATERYNLRFSLEHRENKNLQRQVPMWNFPLGFLL